MWWVSNFFSINFKFGSYKFKEKTWISVALSKFVKLFIANVVSTAARFWSAVTNRSGRNQAKSGSRKFQSRPRARFSFGQHHDQGLWPVQKGRMWRGSWDVGYIPCIYQFVVVGNIIKGKKLWSIMHAKINVGRSTTVHSLCVLESSWFCRQNDTRTLFSLLAVWISWYIR